MHVKRKQHLLELITDTGNKVYYLQQKYDDAINNLKRNHNSLATTNILAQVNDFVAKGESIADKERSLKLTGLLRNTKIIKDTILITNLTSISIPKKVSKVRESGLNNAIGGSPNKMLIATKMEQAFSHWYKYAVEQNCDFVLC